MSVPNLEAIVTAEIDRLTDGDKPERKSAFARMVRDNARAWQELLAEDPVKGKWLALDAYLARTDAQEHRGSVLYAERFAWAAVVAHRLLREHGYRPAGEIPQACHVICRLLGGLECDKALEAARVPREPVLPTQAPGQLR